MLPVIRREDVEQPGALSMVGSIDQFEVNVEGAVGLGGPAIAGGKRDPVFGCRGGDEGIVSGAAGPPVPLWPLLRRALEQLATACSGMPTGG
jgi:hypothetical protein